MSGSPQPPRGPPIHSEPPSVGIKGSSPFIQVLNCSEPVCDCLLFGVGPKHEEKNDTALADSAEAVQAWDREEPDQAGILRVEKIG